MSLPPQVSPPEFALSDVAPSRLVGVGVVAVPVLTRATTAPTLGPGAAELADDLGVDLLACSTRTGADRRDRRGHRAPGRRAPADLANSALTRVLLDRRRRGHAPPTCAAPAPPWPVVRRTRTRSPPRSPPSATTTAMAAFVEGATLGSFGFSLHQRRAHATARSARIVLALTADDEERSPALRRAVATAGASWQARLLASVPSNIKTPGVAGRAGRRGCRGGRAQGHRARREAARRARASAASSASARRAAAPPRFVQLDYKPPKKAPRKAPHVVLVGKGITFDSGGLSIKPGQSMVTMKRDMTGAAVVAAVMAALPDVDCPVRVTGLLPMRRERRRRPRSMRPGDVITQYGGRTTEVTNTDAEGRLVLADGLAYAVDKLDPDVLVDIATLTGAHEGRARPAHRRAVRQRRRPGRAPRRRRGAGPASRCGGCR